MATAKWLVAFEAAWEAADPDRIGALFAEDASYHAGPFDPPYVGRDAIVAYWQVVPATQSDIRVSTELVSDQGGSSVARWSATMLSNGRRLRFDGILLLSFDGEGRCREFREWWHLQKGEVELPNEAIVS